MTVGMIRPIALSRLSHEFLSVMISLGVTRPCTGAWCTTSYQRYPMALSLACKSLPGTRGAGHPRHCEREDHHRLTRFYSISTLLKWYRASVRYGQFGPRRVQSHGLGGAPVARDQLVRGDPHGLERHVCGTYRWLLSSSGYAD